MSSSRSLRKGLWPDESPPTLLIMDFGGRAVYVTPLTLMDVTKDWNFIADVPQVEVAEEELMVINSFDNDF